LRAYSLAYLPIQFSSQILDLMIASMDQTLHTIWITRNLIRLKNVAITSYAPKAKIDTTVPMSGNNSNSH